MEPLREYELRFNDGLREALNHDGYIRLARAFAGLHATYAGAQHYWQLDVTQHEEREREWEAAVGGKLTAVREITDAGNPVIPRPLIRRWENQRDTILAMQARAGLSTNPTDALNEIGKLKGRILKLEAEVSAASFREMEERDAHRETKEKLTVARQHLAGATTARADLLDALRDMVEKETKR